MISLWRLTGLELEFARCLEGGWLPFLLSLHSIWCWHRSLMWFSKLSLRPAALKSMNGIPSHRLFNRRKRNFACFCCWRKESVSLHRSNILTFTFNPVVVVGIFYLRSQYRAECLPRQIFKLVYSLFLVGKILYWCSWAKHCWHSCNLIISSCEHTDAAFTNIAHLPFAI